MKLLEQLQGRVIIRRFGEGSTSEPSLLAAFNETVQRIIWPGYSDIIPVWMILASFRSSMVWLVMTWLSYK